LQLLDICKSYTTGTFTQTALDHVSISFRDNEFVAILGPSGSGKTTMLNIIGGLDHYDSGDLAIEGVSTKQYKDKDWDAYRNNRIGFVFQSYNLIPHQTVLANVELALTLSGVSREERRQRAVEALERVGLGEHINKKPSQLSGGQMQRVAIARALINDPEILLADEPTGALDSKTSVQIMDLLVEIAADRLVIMVTHNPELAEEYATRIVNLSDGVITSDSDPYNPSEDEIAAANAKPQNRTRMSFLTALSLSANNLLTKKGRTIMTAIAGSIGIIGIAAILALANGVNNYIKSVEEETLSVYPLQIMSSGFDFTTMLVGNAASSSDPKESADANGDATSASDASASGSSSSSSGSSLFTPVPEGMIGESKMMSRMFASIGSNDLAALKEYLDSGESDIQKYTNGIYYEYAVTPQIFDANTENGVRQVNPDTSFSSLGIGSGASTNSLVSMSMSTDMFSEMMDNNAVVTDQYEVLAGHWPEKENELVLVLSQSSRISDFLSYILGLRDSQELKDMVKQFTNEEEVTVPTDRLLVSYEDVLGLKFKLVNATKFYKYDEEYGVWVDKTDDKEYMKEQVDAGEDLVIAGIVKPKPEASALALSVGLYYTPALTRSIVETAMESDIVKDQLADSKRDVFTGKTFDELEEENSADFDMSSLFTIDENAMQAAFTFNADALNLGSMDLSGIDLSAVDLSKIEMPDFDASQLDLSGVTPQMTPADVAALFPELDNQALAEMASGINVKFTDGGQALNAATSSIIQGYVAWSQKNPNGDINAYVSTPAVQQQLAAVGQTVDTQALQNQLVTALSQRLSTTPQNVGNVISQRVTSAFVASMASTLQEQLSASMQQYMAKVMSQVLGEVTTTLRTQISTTMASAMSQLGANMQNAIGFDASAFENAFQFNMSESELAELMTSMMRVEQHSYDNNLKKLGYADFAKPSEISLYPVDFESKESIVQILDDYNERMRATDEDKVISYTDLVGTLMESVTDIVNMISYVLIAFVAISLIVSSIMIGVITYISVLERIKEIGILRSIGASKGDISRVFNAETIIEGFIAGLLGVGVTALACIPANAIVYATFDVPNVALLPPNAAAILVIISVLLTFVAGLIPSKSASRKDPVEALRSE
ncbi:MAG: ABC transporter ATP-binding protein/permease, partial [Eggerthellaceae bacterium]|nr:ABC transporter ATP-binding protein/permease [Eggerthellaceae bacterium]